MRPVRLYRGFIVAAALAAAFSLANGLALAGDEGFHVKRSGMASVGPPGASRRIVQAFTTWTLICDEDLIKHQRVCNVSQEIVDAEGHMAFNWSLAGTRAGAPVMILRAPASGSVAGRVVDLTFSGASAVRVNLDTCDPTLCIGFLPVTKAIGGALRQEGSAQAVFMRDGRLVTIELPLKELTTALAAMKTR